MRTSASRSRASPRAGCRASAPVRASVSRDDGHAAPVEAWRYQARQAPVERHELRPALQRDAQEVGVGHLTMTDESIDGDKPAICDGQIVRDENMTRAGKDGLEHVDGLAR